MSSSSSVRVNENETLSPDVIAKPVVNVPENGFIQPPPLRVRLLCELIGTCLFVLFGAGCAAKAHDLLTASAAHALVTVWLVYVFGPVSGGHFNAGATIAFALDGKMKLIEIFGYLLAQGIGSLIAGVLLLALYGTGSPLSLGTPGLSPGVSVVQGFTIEFICTTVLSFVICFTTSYNSHKEAAFPIGLVVFSSFLIGADRDGSALNPWRWFGPAVASGTFHSEAWIYVVGPITGFLFGYGLFRLYKLIWNGRGYTRF
jgi:glycerol uptake facilitator-like aquaporin